MHDNRTSRRLLWALVTLTLAACGGGGGGGAPDAPDLPFARRAGGAGLDTPRGLAVRADGSFVVAGDFSGSAVFGPGEAQETTLTATGLTDMFVALYNADGTLAFARRAGGAARVFGGSVAVADDGSFYVGGIFRGSATFGPGEAGETTLASAGGDDAYLAGYNPDGTLAFAVRAGGSGGDHLYGLALLDDGSLLVTGSFSIMATFGPGEAGETTLTAVEGHDVFLARYAADGELDFVKSAGGGPGEDVPLGMAAWGDGSCVITGYFQQTTTFGPGEPGETVLTSVGMEDIFVARYNADGALDGAMGMGSTGDDYALNVRALADGSFALAGGIRDTTTFGPGEPNETVLTWPADEFRGFVAKFHPDRTLAFATLAGDNAGDLVLRDDGSILAVGDFVGTRTFGAGDAAETVLTSAGGLDGWIAGWQADGTLEFATREGGIDYASLVAIAPLPSGGYVVAGAFAGSATFGEGLAREATLTSAGRNDIVLLGFRL